MSVSSPLFQVNDLHAQPAGSDHGEILRGVDLTVNTGEVHAIVGPDGSGTSTLGSTLMGSADSAVTAGSVHFLGDDVTEWLVDDRAKAGMFLAFRDPHEIAGVSVIEFLRQARSARTGIDLSASEIRLATREWMTRLDMDSTFVDRHLNTGATGGERQRSEIVQMAILEPEIAILDAADVRMDVDTLQIIARGIREVRTDRPEMGVVLITPQQRLLEEVSPDHVHLLIDGRIVASGGMELAEQLDRVGSESLQTVGA